MQPFPSTSPQPSSIDGIISIRESPPPYIHNQNQNHNPSPQSINSSTPTPTTTIQRQSSPNQIIKHSHSSNCSIVGNSTTNTSHISHPIDHNFSVTFGKPTLSSLVQPLTITSNSAFSSTPQNPNDISKSTSSPSIKSKTNNTSQIISNNNIHTNNDNDNHNDNNNTNNHDNNNNINMNDDNNNTNNNDHPKNTTQNTPQNNNKQNNKSNQPKQTENLVDINNWDSTLRVTTRTKTT